MLTRSTEAAPSAVEPAQAAPVSTGADVELRREEGAEEAATGKLSEAGTLVAEDTSPADDGSAANVHVIPKNRMVHMSSFSSSPPRKSPRGIRLTL
jgi:hypothetical protein